jgi:hypothetical protein
MNTWLAIALWAVFLLYTWMLADLQHAAVVYLRAKKIKTMYEITALHNAAVEYSDKVLKERGTEVDGCKFHTAPESPAPPNT